MRISIYKNYLSAPDFRPKNKISKADIENRIENKLRKLGFVVDCNGARIEVSNTVELGKMLVQLKKLNIDSLELMGYESKNYTRTLRKVRNSE